MFPAHVLDQFVAAIDSGKHVILTGPRAPGRPRWPTWAPRSRNGRCCAPATYPPRPPPSGRPTRPSAASSRRPEGLIFRPGLFVDAIESGRWLVIDELNRSNFDRAFGQLFTVLSGQPVVLPFKRKGTPNPLSIVPPAWSPRPTPTSSGYPASGGSWPR